MRFERPRFVGVKAPGKEQRVTNEIVVEVIVNEVPQLAGNVPSRQSHVDSTRAGEPEGEEGSKAAKLSVN